MPDKVAAAKGHHIGDPQLNQDALLGNPCFQTHGCERYRSMVGSLHHNRNDPKDRPNLGSTVALSECANGLKVKTDGNLVGSGAPPPCICSMVGFWIVWVQHTARPHVAADPQVTAHRRCIT
jgi:hypothetical protein